MSGDKIKKEEEKQEKTDKKSDNIKLEKEAVKKTTEVKIAEKEEKIAKEENNPLFSGETEELPEEIKKKLAQKKEEKSKRKVKRKKKAPRSVKVGRAYVKATYNNTIITLTDNNGNVLSWASAGMAGFKGAKKSTPYAAQIITKIAVTGAREDFGLEEVSVFVKGVGTGRESAVRALNANGLEINSIKDITPVPHNGCRARKPRRV
jgi:small subunit ribosomal protein S11